MSTFNELEQQTIKEHCGDWVLYSVDELENQLAAERAKVAEVDAKLTDANSRHGATFDRQMNAVCRFHDEKDKAAELEADLKAERAKVALAIEALEWYASGRTWHQWLPDSAGDKARKAIAVLQSSDALADIRREVARECASIARAMLFAAPESKWESSCNDAFERVSKAIRAKFGVTG